MLQNKLLRRIFIVEKNGENYVNSTICTLHCQDDQIKGMVGDM
jgi:hypothetical protein